MLFKDLAKMGGIVKAKLIRNLGYRLGCVKQQHFGFFYFQFHHIFDKGDPHFFFE